MTIDEAMSSDQVNSALAMGLSVGRIKTVMQRRLNTVGRPFNDLQALVSAVLDRQIEDEGFESPEGNRRLQNQVANIILSAVNSVAEDSAPSTSSAVPESRTVENLNSEDTEMCAQSRSTITPQASEEGVKMRNVECKICMQEEVGVVFLPCGHLLSCVICAPALSNCPLCRQTITSELSKLHWN